jgi:hypothetical protein
MLRVMRAFLLSTLLLAATDAPTFELEPRLARFLEDGRWDATPQGFRIIALSHLADGCAAQFEQHPAEARACVEAVLKRAKALPAASDGLFLSHLNLVYGAGDRTGPCLDEAAHARLSRELARRSLADPLAHAASYEKLPLRWPADQAATLASLARYDEGHGTRVLQQPLEAWKKVMAEHLDEKTGLPWSEVTGKAPGAKHPRGCAQSFITRYLGEVDPALASEWWQRYREHFTVRVAGMVGFREWPPGVERRGDVDSGPIVLGIGTAASAFAISAAKSQGDTVLAAQLEASASTVMATGVGGAAAKGILPLAIRYQGRFQP